VIIIKNKLAIERMKVAGHKLASIFDKLSAFVQEGVTTLSLDATVEKFLREEGLRSECKGYGGYKHVSCISVNDEVVHGVPSLKQIKLGDLVKIDVCASWQGYCADMARCFSVGPMSPEIQKFVVIAQESLDVGIKKMYAGNRLGDISHAIQQVVESAGYGIVRDFAGHGIGKKMHEEPEILNYGDSGTGPILRLGMAFAIEPMITLGSYEVYITEDKWTVKTEDGSIAAHVEDTVLITENGPEILTRLT
jgi:methionyl aminopeptidase